MAQRSPRRSRTGRSSAPGGFPVTLSPKLSGVLLGFALGFLAIHIGLALYHYRVEELPWLLRQLFDVDQENNLPTWYSAFLLLTASALLWLCARRSRAEAPQNSVPWHLLAAGFLLLSVDEVAGVHETINSVIVMTWAIPGGIAALAIGLTFVPFLRRLPRSTAACFCIAGAMYLGGAAGIEVFGSDMVGRQLRDTLDYNLATLAEESLEMLGIVFFVHTLLSYMRSEDGEEATLKVA